MKLVLTTLNAKYIHTSLALRWLYVANKDYFDISLQEYTIKEDIALIQENILQENPQVVAIGVSIWNVSLIEKLVLSLKHEQPELIIILGGPEVSYEPAFFLENWPVDFVISGEGEFVLRELLLAIKEDKNTHEIKAVSSPKHISTHVAQAAIKDLELLDSRSEERRVGKECRSTSAASHGK